MRLPILIQRLKWMAENERLQGNQANLRMLNQAIEIIQGYQNRKKKQARKAEIRKENGE